MDTLYGFTISARRIFLQHHQNPMANHNRTPTSPWSLRPPPDCDSADETNTPPATRSAKSPHLTAELEYWRQKAFFLREEYQHLLTFVHMLGHITAMDRSVEAALQSARVAAVENLVSALVFMEDEVVEYVACLSWANVTDWRFVRQVPAECACAGGRGECAARVEWPAAGDPRFCV